MSVAPIECSAFVRKLNILGFHLQNRIFIGKCVFPKMLLDILFIREDFHFTPYSTISYLVPGKPFNQIYVEFPAANDQPISSYHKIFSNMIGQQASASSEYAEARNKKRKIKANIDCKGKRCRNDPGIVVIDD